MSKRDLPAIALESRDIRFKTPERALAVWDKSIQAKKADDASATISILGEIGPAEWGDVFSAKATISALKDAGKRPVVVNINSPGGSAFEGVAIYNLLREHPYPVTVNVLGVAASAAAIIAMAGDRINVHEGALMMIHSVWGMAVGNKNDMRELATIFDKMDNAIAEIFSVRTGNDMKSVLEMMEKETWLNADEAVEKGFADKLVAEPKKKAAVNLADFVKESALAALGERRAIFAAIGRPLPGASGLSSTVPKGPPIMATIQEQSLALQNQRTANAKRLDDIMQASLNEGRSFNESEEQEYNDLKIEIVNIDKRQEILREHEKLNISRATPVKAEAGLDPDAASKARQPSGIVSVKRNVPEGTAFTRYVMALAAARGNRYEAFKMAENNQKWKDTPEVITVLNAAVAAGTTTDTTWAEPLVEYQTMAGEFLELLRPQTVIGRIPGLRRVPFNIRMASQTTGSTVGWVGEGAAKPVSKLGFGEVTLRWAKAAGIVVLTEELIRASNPSAEAIVRQDLISEMAQFLDEQFLSPEVGEVSNVSPGSITAGVTPSTVSGTNSAALRTDIQTLFNVFITNNLNPQGAVWIMPPTTALAISMMQNALDQPEFPGISMNGGNFMGLPVITSMSSVFTGSPTRGNIIVLLIPSEIMLADDGQVMIDVSREASLQMDGAPTQNSTGTPTATSVVSLWQTNSVAIRAERWINWKRRRNEAVAWLNNVQYTSA
jgi:HK97 family phage major capsid protein